ncbi:hypothetical protein ACRALDRAFT_1065033 [Sodiomyces alcalophilus JCM 7366]|uniref:uncharacterized protein n=1 Tax=Sodiomyces alcalophilus JCM 7366 TaxID=591952 RepID=UPI0039B4E0C1
MAATMKYEYQLQDVEPAPCRSVLLLPPIVSPWWQEKSILPKDIKTTLKLNSPTPKAPSTLPHRQVLTL